MFSLKLTAMSLGYFLYDLLACYWFGLIDSKILVHHLLCIFTFIYPFVTGKGIFGGILGLSMAESTNFPMHTRVIMKLMGLRHTRLYEIFDVIYLMVYIFVRGIISLPLVVVFFLDRNMPIFISIMFLGMVMHSMGFMLTMFKIVKNKNLQRLERKSKNVELFWVSVNPEINNLDYVKKKIKHNVF